MVLKKVSVICIIATLLLGVPSFKVGDSFATNLNNLQTTGIYRVSADSANIPSSGVSYGFCLVMGNTNDVAVVNQLVVGYNTSDNSMSIFVRARRNWSVNSWQAWQEK